MLGWHSVPTGPVPCPSPPGRGRGLSLGLSQHGMRVPAVNTLITLGWMSQEQKPAGMDHHIPSHKQVEFSLAEPYSSCWRLHTLFFKDGLQGN